MLLVVGRSNLRANADVHDLVVCTRGKLEDVRRDGFLAHFVLVVVVVMDARMEHVEKLGVRSCVWCLIGWERFFGLVFVLE